MDARDLGPDLPRATARALIADMATERPDRIGAEKTLEDKQRASSRRYHHRHYVPAREGRAMRLLIELEDGTVARLLMDLAVAMGAVEVIEVPVESPESIDAAWRAQSARERGGAPADNEGTAALLSDGRPRCGRCAQCRPPCPGDTAP